MALLFCLAVPAYGLRLGVNPDLLGWVPKTWIKQFFDP
jgi:hypothetical protein